MAAIGAAIAIQQTEQLKTRVTSILQAGSGRAMPAVASSDHVAALATLDDIQHGLDSITTPKGLLAVIEQADVLKHYARRVIKSADIQNRCALVKVLAQHRAGHLLRQMPRAPSGGAQSARGEKHWDSFGRSLDAHGITTQQASRWQRVADLPRELIQAEWERAGARGEEFTETRVHALAKQRQNAERNAWQAAQYPDQTEQMRQETAARQAVRRLAKRFGTLLTAGDADGRRLALVLADRKYVHPHEIEHLRQQVLAVAERLAERGTAPMEVPFEASILTDEERQQFKALAKRNRPP